MKTRGAVTEIHPDRRIGVARARSRILNVRDIAATLMRTAWLRRQCSFRAWAMILRMTEEQRGL